jgi:hypothetical protein
MDVDELEEEVKTRTQTYIEKVNEYLKGIKDCRNVNILKPIDLDDLKQEE